MKGISLSKLRVLIAGGGTGGHIIPALAVAHELVAHYNAEILFVGTARGMESRLVPAAGFKLHLVEVGQLKNVSLLTRLRTLNGPALVERCYRSWRQNQPINLHYRDEAGLEATAPILAARAVLTDEGHVLLLWLHVERDDMELEIDEDDEDDEDIDTDDHYDDDNS